MTILQRAVKAYHASPLTPPGSFLIPRRHYRALRRAVKRAAENKGHRFYCGYGVFLLLGIPVIASSQVRRITVR